MLTQEENELLCQTGRGTPMGDMMRRYWMPALLSEELPEPDGTPVRVRLLGENLVAFRDTDGRVGIVEEACAHRCASLAYARNEQGGLRCIYHGWKYDVHGNVLETPAEPAQSMIKHHVKLLAYPVREVADVVWAYMGPPDKEPVFPEWEWTRAPADRRRANKTLQECNYLQALEGDLDSSHSDYLHSSELRGRPRDHSPVIAVEDTPYGYRYAAIRKPDQDADKTKYVRVTLFVAPFYSFIPPQRSPGREFANQHAYVPIDDDRHAFFSFTVDRLGSVANGQYGQATDRDPNYVPFGNRANMHLQDRALMKAGNWTGIDGIRAQDRAVTESMGPLTPRQKEHLGLSDSAVAALRRRLLESARAFMAGADPVGVDPSIAHSELHSEERFVSIEEPWQRVLESPLAVG